MRRVVAIIACAALAFGIGANAGASAPRIIAHVRCAAPAEDTLAHVRLVDFTRRADGAIVVTYRCERTGY